MAESSQESNLAPTDTKDKIKMDDIKHTAGQDDQINKMLSERLCITLSSVPQLMRSTLDNLSETDFKRFKSNLKEISGIPLCKLEKADIDDTVHAMGQTYCVEESSKVMLIILRNMHQDQLAAGFERELYNVISKTLDKAALCSSQEISSLKRHLQSLLLKKFHLICQDLEESPGKKEKLQDIYIDLCIIEGTGGVSSSHEVSAMHLRQTKSRTFSGSMNSVKLSNIFPDHYHTSKPGTKVLTLGIAGVGKTFAVRKFVLDWAEDTKNQYIDFIFVLPFRELNMHKDKDYSLFDLLLEFYSDLEELRELTGLKNAIVLFVFDGLDESRLQLDFNKHVCDPQRKSSVAILITSLMTGKLLPYANIWVTTRPAAANKDLCELFDLVTEVQGFSDREKEEYFEKNIPEKAEEVITHIKSNKSLHIMCQIPVFCRITATVFNEMGDEQKVCNHQIPKTLTEMYMSFSLFQIRRMNEKYLKEKKMSAEEKGELLVKLGKLAFKHLEKGTLIFYEKDLTEVSIDVNAGTLQAGLCTQIFKKESAISGESMFSFVHLSVQEFLAALYVLHTHATLQTNLLIKTYKQRAHWMYDKSRFNLYKISLDTASLSENGHLDLCVRFLLGLAPMLEREVRSPLDVVLPRLNDRKGEVSIKKTVEYIKKMISTNISPERIINLFHCLNELGDNSLVEEINRYSSADKKKNLTPAQCSALAYLLLMSAESLEEFDLKKYLRSEEGLRRMIPVVRITRIVWLNRCHLSKASCVMMASALQFSSHLRELDMSDNNLQDEGVKLLSVGLRDPQCQLETLRLNWCHLSKASCEMTASVLQGTPSHLRELDMSDNDLQDEGVQLLCVGLSAPQCKLETLRLSGCLIKHKGCSFLASALKSNPSHLKQLDLSYNHPGDSGVRELTDRRNDPECKLETFTYDHGGECRIEQGLRKYACALTLDPNTAGRHLCLSEGNRKVAHVSEEQLYPDHPERFDFYYYQVLCEEGLSGRCYWEAEWRGDKAVIAVAYKSIQRKGERDDSCFGWNDKSWSLRCSAVRYSVCHNKKETDIPAPSSRSSRVGVYLDWPASTLSFYSVSSDTLTHLHTFHSTFTEPLYPGFGVGYNVNSLVCLCGNAVKGVELSLVHYRK